MTALTHNDDVYMEALSLLACFTVITVAASFSGESLGLDHESKLPLPDVVNLLMSTALVAHDLSRDLTKVLFCNFFLLQLV